MSGLSCVVDASVAVKLFLVEPLSSQATDLFAILAAEPSSIFHVPDLFYAETANIFWKQCQRGNRSLAQAELDYEALRTLRLQVTPVFELGPEALKIAVAHGLSAYDACYVALAQRNGLSLITADDKLVNKLAGSPHSVTWLGHWTP